MAATAYIKSLKFASNDTMQQLEKIENFHSQRLWHQATVELRTFVQRPDVQSQLVDFYKKFVVDMETRMNALQLVEIVICVSKNMGSMEDAIALLDSLNEKVSSDKLAARLIKITKAQIILENKSDEESLRTVRTVVKELGPEIEREDGVSAVHSRFFEMAALYYSKLCNHEQFYRNTLRYLGCRDDISEYGPEFSDCGFKLCLAALLADNVYNFGELLQHKILEPLRASSNGWIVELVDAFNSGNIQKVKQLESQWQTQTDLKNNTDKLTEKLRLSALMESVFARSAKDRCISFSEISSLTGLPLDRIEWLVMRGLSLNLIKGYLDQVDRTATITWVQPRVLNREQVAKMGARVGDWIKEVQGMETVIHQRSREMVQF